jgi:hypothetical protein
VLRQVPVFKSHNIKLVIRLNKSHYDRRPFVAAGMLRVRSQSVL